MKVLWNIFKHSMKLPQRQAAFSLNRIGMDMIILYIFLLLAFASVPGLINEIQKNTNAVDIHLQVFFLLIFFFIFYYLILMTAVFACISLIAYIGTFIARVTQRKLRYSILWKMAACITTIPMLLFTLISFFYTVNDIFLVLALTFHVFVFVQTIFLYPRRRSNSKK